MSGEVMTGAEMVIRAFWDQGVDTLFGYPGGAVLPIYDALFHQEELKHVLVRHEQGAVHAAEGYARSSGKVGCVLVTSGPGATNIVTGLTDAMLDSIPLVCITGQVPTHLIGTDAFQECDTVGITRPLHQAQLPGQGSINELAQHHPRGLLRIASVRPSRVRSSSIFRRMFSSPPAPTSAAIGMRTVQKSYQPKPARATCAGRSSQAVEMMAKGARRPVHLFRRRCHQFRPGSLGKLLRELVELTGFPDHVDADGPGRLSRHRARTGWACWACTARSRPIWRCTTATSWSVSVPASTTASPAASMRFRRISKKIHIDIDPSSINKTVQASMFRIIGDMRQSLLDDMVARLEGASAKRCRQGTLLKEWWDGQDPHLEGAAATALAYKMNDA